MSLTYRTRKKIGTANVSLRYRPNKDIDIWIATPFKLPADDWDQANQCYKRNLIIKSPRTEIDKIKNEKIKLYSTLISLDHN